METISKRTTVFNAYCSEKRKENPSAGFCIKLWAREWQQLSTETKNSYKQKAKTGNKSNSVNCLQKIMKLINRLKSAREASGIEGIGLIVLRNGVLTNIGFGGLENCLDDAALHLKILGLTTGGTSANNKKSSIEDLRSKATEKMSKIAKEQLGLNLFPYKRVAKGEFTMSGVPPLLLPLRPAGKLNIKQLEVLLAAQISIARAPAAQPAQVTDLPQAAAVEVTDSPQAAAVEVTDSPQAAAVEVTDVPQAAAVPDFNLPQAGHKRVATSKAENMSKKQKWDDDTQKAIEERLSTMRCPPGLAQMEELKSEIPALAKFSALDKFVLFVGYGIKVILFVTALQNFWRAKCPSSCSTLHVSINVMLKAVCGFDGVAGHRPCRIRVTASDSQLQKFAATM